MEYHYRLTNKLRSALNRCELLGQDSAEQAAIAVLNSETWQHDYDLSEADTVDLDTIRKWKEAVLLDNEVKTSTNGLMGADDLEPMD